MTQKPISIIGVPVEAGARLGGCLMGPAALRTAGLVRPLEQLGYVVRDQGDLAIARDAGTLPSKEPRNLAEIAAWARVLSASVYGCLRDGAFPLVLGGDHSLSIGSIDGVARFCAETQRELFVLWLDAHADFNTLETSPSGNVHGMPLAALCGEPGFEALLGGGTRRVDPAHVSLFGIRSLDVGERALLEARSIDVVDMRTIDEFGVVVPLRRILDRVAAAKGFLHVSLDVDFLDPAIAPGVGTPVPGGTTFREAHLIMEMLYDSGLAGSLDVVELNPFFDERGKSALVLSGLVASLFGRRIFGHPVNR
ncbi:MAG: arginase [Beijerinckiaceae bacterium]